MNGFIIMVTLQWREDWEYHVIIKGYADIVSTRIRLLLLFNTTTRLRANTERMCSVSDSRNWKK